jgi:sensor histidine kinase regulating citrate/malate metabolism
MPGYPLVAIRSFIEATRDSGYKSTSAAIAELVDNSFEAEADLVEVTIADDEDGAKRVSVTDNGTGMPAGTMQLALQFGGSTRASGNGDHPGRQCAESPQAVGEGVHLARPN